MTTKKTRLLILVILSLLILAGSGAWAYTSHKEFSTITDFKLCNSCHQQEGVPPAVYGFQWVAEHRLYAEKRPNLCADCHQQSFCLDCHRGGGIDRNLHTSNTGVDYKPLIHRSDWRELHPIKASDKTLCYRCHDAKGFCNECHSKFKPEELRFQSHRKGWSDLEVKQAGPQHSVFTAAQCEACHPNSVLPKHQWSSSHAREARKNLASCQTCHSEGDVCLKCHSAKEGLKVNPHPRSWGKISGKMKKAGDNRTCIKCHP